MAVKPIPTGFRTITPYLAVRGAAEEVVFIKRAFGGKVTVLMKGTGGTVMHAQLKVGSSIIMVGEPMGPTAEPMPCMLYLYVPKCDAVFKRAVKAGASVVSEPTNQFYGDRTAAVKDAAGVVWHIATAVEKVSPKEMKRRMAAMRG